MATDATHFDREGNVIIPVVEEELKVSKREVVTGVVRVTKRIEERVEQVGEVLHGRQVRVERLPKEREIDVMPEPRQEGQTLVISVVEERLVTRKQLVLVEEIHITTIPTEQAFAADVTLRRERATVDRLSAPVVPAGEATANQAAESSDSRNTGDNP